MPEDHGDEGAPGLPPDPLDRVWFHPSELGAPAAETDRSPGPPQWAIVTIAALCGALATVGVLAGTGSIGSDGGTVGDSSSFVPVFAQLQRDHTADLVSSAGASVVAIRVTTTDASTVDASGVALGGDRIVTSADVVAGASQVTVTTDHGRVLTATVVGADPETDLALLDVDEARIPPADMGSSDDLSVGTWVLAVAAAGGEDRWASQGVVSGLDVLVDRGSGATMPGMVATDVDAPASAGGGVLLDDDGSVVAILSRAAPGHAVPVEAAREVAEQLGASGRVRHAWLGIDAVDAASREGGGAVVEAVSDGGPGQAAELQPGDVITSIDEARVADLADLVAAVAHRRPGDQVELSVVRGDRRLELRTSLGERP
jgi:S1-C subfamily serine protease